MPQLITSVKGVEIHHDYLDRERTTLGRRVSNHIVLPDIAVSGEHCVFELHGLASVYVQDLGSTNGTYVNDHMVKRHLLNDCDIITIGKFKLQYFSANELMDEGRTATIPLDSAHAHSNSPMHASLKVLSGSSAGLELPVAKAVTTFGKQGVARVAIAHRRHGYYISCIDAQQDKPTLNGMNITDDPVMLTHGDVLTLAGTTLEVVLH